MKNHTKTDEIQNIVASLKDHRTCLLIVDTKQCQHSHRLVEEVKVATELNAVKNSPKIMHILDLCEQDGKALDILTWLPGVPCLLAGNKVHLGVDAFTKCRELSRDMQGLSLQTLSLRN